METQTERESRDDLDSILRLIEYEDCQEYEESLHPSDGDLDTMTQADYVTPYGPVAIGPGMALIGGKNAAGYLELALDDIMATSDGFMTSVQITKALAALDITVAPVGVYVSISDQLAMEE